MKNVDKSFQIRAILGKLRARNSSNINEGPMYEYNLKLLGLYETYHIICISAEVEFNERYG